MGLPHSTVQSVERRTFWAPGVRAAQNASGPGDELRSPGGEDVGFVGRGASVTSTQLCCHSRRAAADRA